MSELDSSRRLKAQREIARDRVSPKRPSTNSNAKHVTIQEPLSAFPASGTCSSESMTSDKGKGKARSDSALSSKLRQPSFLDHNLATGSAIGRSSHVR